MCITWSFDRRLPAALLCAAGLLAACGGGSAGSAADGQATGMQMEESGTGMQMGGDDATDARDVEGAALLTGAFGLLDTRPPGTDGVRGSAWLAHGDAGTTVTIEFTGLAADHEFMAHVHAETCDVEAGGPHFQFEEGGATTPPNEIHLMFTSAADGSGKVTVTDPKDVGDRAKSVVLHPVEAMDNRIACADLA